MMLNLHIIKRDLLGGSLVGTPREEPSERRLLHAMPAEGAVRARADVVYVGGPEGLGRLGGYGTSYLCLGTPEVVPSAGTSLVYLPSEEAGDLTAADLLDEVSELFARYDRWERDLSSVIFEHRALAELGRVSRGVLRNPVFVVNEGFRVLFHDTEALRREDREAHAAYCRIMSGGPDAIGEEGYPPEELMRAMMADPAYGAVLDATEPTFYEVDASPYRSLAYNLGPRSNRAGTVVFDEVLHPITEGDEALIRVLGEYVERGIREGQLESFARPSEVNYVLEGLLAHRFLDAWRIDAVVEGFGWGTYDDYVCACVESVSYERSGNYLRTFVPELERRLESPCHVVDGRMATFVVNLKAIDSDVFALAESLDGFARRNLLAIGVSRRYQDFKDLYYYRRQARLALGAASGEAGTHLFEGVATHELLSRCLGDDPEESLIPEGLLRLLEHDRGNGTDLVGLLDAYLQCGMRTAETCRRTYTARNTCIYRLNRIREISGLDLDDPKVRLQVEVALGVMLRGW